MRETRPGIDMGSIRDRYGIDMASDDELSAYVNETGQAAWPLIATCKMGQDANAVVDAE